MPNPDKNGCLPFTVRFKPDESNLLLALRRHLEKKRDGKSVTQSETLREALYALAAKEKRNGFQA